MPPKQPDPMSPEAINAAIEQLHKDDAICVVWRESEDEQYQAGPTETWEGAVVVEARHAVGEAGNAPKRIDVLWKKAQAQYVGKGTRLPEQGCEYFSITKVKKAARGQIPIVAVAQGQAQPAQQHVQQNQANQAQGNPQDGSIAELLGTLGVSEEGKNALLEHRIDLRSFALLNDKDLDDMHIPIGDKGLIRAFTCTATKETSRKPEQQTMRQLQAALLGDDDAPVLIDDSPEEPDFGLYDVSKIRSVDLAALWQQKIAFTLSSTGSSGMAPVMRTEIDNSLRLLRQLRAIALTGSDVTNALTTVVEGLARVLIRVTIPPSNRGAAVQTFDAKLEKQRDAKRRALRPNIAYCCIVNEVLAAHNTQKRPFRPGRGFRDRYSARSNQGPALSATSQKTDTCRLCGQQFGGSWWRHMPNCPAAGKDHQRQPEA